MNVLHEIHATTYRKDVRRIIEDLVTHGYTISPDDATKDKITSKGEHYWLVSDESKVVFAVEHLKSNRLSMMFDCSNCSYKKANDSMISMVWVGALVIGMSALILALAIWTAQ